jgi:hypothetical protein
MSALGQKRSFGHGLWQRRLEINLRLWASDTTHDFIGISGRDWRRVNVASEKYLSA